MKKTWRLSKTMRTFIGIVLLILIYPVFAENSTHLFLKTSSEDGKDFVSFTTNEVKK